MNSPNNPLRFTVALSFPGEQREFVEQVADLLAATQGQERILYDYYHDAEFARLDLNIYLPSLYRKESELIAIFLCPQYPNKQWCKLEWRHIAQLIATADANRIMFFSFGDPGDVSELGILSGDGYIDIENPRRTLNPQAVVDKILKRLSINRGIAPPPVNPPVNSPSPQVSPASFKARKIWQEKLAYLQQAEAITADPAQRFELRMQIEEAQAKIAEYSAAGSGG